MAVKARPWTAADREIARLLTENKEARKWSFRTIEEKSGINYVRVRDISNAVHGTPTVSEFLAICDTFDLDPASTLRQIVARAAEIEAAESASPAGERRPVDGVGDGSTTTAQVADDLIDRIAAHPEDYDVAANMDENRDVESETPDD